MWFAKGLQRGGAGGRRSCFALGMGQIAPMQQGAAPQYCSRFCCGCGWLVTQTKAHTKALQSDREICADRPRFGIFLAALPQEAASTKNIMLAAQSKPQQRANFSCFVFVEAAEHQQVAPHRATSWLCKVGPCSL